MVSLEKRDTSTQGNFSKIRLFEAAALEMGVCALPATPELVEDFIAYGIVVKDWDSTTIVGILQAVSDWHIHATRMGFPIANPVKNGEVQRRLKVVRKHLKKPSAAKHSLSVAQVRAMYQRGYNNAGLQIPPEGLKGLQGLKIRQNWHTRICFTMLCLGCMRQNAASVLRIRYQLTPTTIIWEEDSDIQVRWDEELGKRCIRYNVEADKNVDSTSARFSWVPEAVPGLDCYPVEELEFYVRHMGPPSGSFLCHAPCGHTGPLGELKFWPETKGKKKKHNKIMMGYQNWSEMVQRMYQRAFPDAKDKALYGSHTGRKSLSQMVWDKTQNKRLISDIGGWAVARSAVDLYFRTSPDGILATIAEMGT